MRSGALAAALLCVTVGLALGFAPRRALAPSVAVLFAAALAVSFVELPAWGEDAAFLGCWAGVVLSAAALHLPGGVGPRASLALALNGGIWAGGVVAAAGAPADLAKALPWALLCAPALMLRERGWALAPKVLASWLAAVAVLAAGLSMGPATPGYEPDHME